MVDRGLVLPGLDRSVSEVDLLGSLGAAVRRLALVFLDLLRLLEIFLVRSPDLPGFTFGGTLGCLAFRLLLLRGQRFEIFLRLAFVRRRLVGRGLVRLLLAGSGLLGLDLVRRLLRLRVRFLSRNDARDEQDAQEEGSEESLHGRHDPDVETKPTV